MGLFSGLLKRRLRTTMLAWQGDGAFDFEIVGESYYQDALSRVCGGRTEDGHQFECDALLVPEPNNPYDRLAIAVHIGGRKVGHLARGCLREYHAALQECAAGTGPITCAAVIVGGWDRGRRGQGHFGVKLDLLWPPQLRRT